MLDGIAPKLERYLDIVSARQKLVASNIANADTPGYKTQDIDFEAEMRNATDCSLALTPVETPGLVTKNDGNNVNLDREGRMLAENTMRFNIATQLLRSEIRQLRTAINEGKN